MWIFTNQGFISAVQHRDKPQHLMVRARRLEHLRAIFPGEEVTQTENADYRYRVTVHTIDFKKALCAQVDVLEYDNFKRSIPDHEYHDACSQVWGVMHRLQPGSWMPERDPDTDDLFY